MDAHIDVEIQGISPLLLNSWGCLIGQPMDASIDVEIRGTAPIICHNAQLSDPLNEWAKAIAEISSKRKKTEADHLEMSHREFLGGLYMGPKGPVIPAGNIEKMIRDAAAGQKKGKDVQSGAIVLDDAPIIYDGPKDPEKLWKSGKFSLRATVGVNRARVMRTRPWWTEWGLKFRIDYDTTLLNRASLVEFLKIAGRVKGLGDWRPKHGRFEVVSVS